MNKETNDNNLQKIITQVINEIKEKQGDAFDIAKVNLADLERRTGITRGRLALD